MRAELANLNHYAVKPRSRQLVLLYIDQICVEVFGKTINSLRQSTTFMEHRISYIKMLCTSLVARSVRTKF